MSKATKAIVQDLCRRNGYELGSARRRFTTEWVIEVYGTFDGRRVLLREATDVALAAAYGDLAVWLRARCEQCR